MGAGRLSLHGVILSTFGPCRKRKSSADKRPGRLERRYVYLNELNMKTIEYIPSGVCSRHIRIEVSDEGTVAEVIFTGGCHGNTQGVAALVKGMPVGEVIARLKGIDCKGRGTSCPDQLVRALETSD